VTFPPNPDLSLDAADALIEFLQAWDGELDVEKAARAIAMDPKRLGRFIVDNRAMIWPPPKPPQAA
jgi:hypothetical protein